MCTLPWFYSFAFWIRFLLSFATNFFLFLSSLSKCYGQLQIGNSSAADAKVASVGTDVHYGREYGGRPRRGYSGQHDALAAVLRMENWDYAKWCAGCFDHEQSTTMVFDGNNKVVYDQSRRSCDTAVGAYIWRWKELARTCTGISPMFEHVDMPFVRHHDEVEYVCRLSD